MGEESLLNPGIDWVRVVPVRSVEDFINKSSKSRVVERRTADPDDLVIRREVAARDKVVERRDQLKLGEITSDANDNESEAIHTWLV